MTMSQKNLTPEDLSQKRAVTKSRFENELESKRAKVSTAEMDENNYYMMTKAKMTEEQAKLDAEFADEPEHRQIELIGCRAGKYVRVVFMDSLVNSSKGINPRQHHSWRIVTE